MGRKLVKDFRDMKKSASFQEADTVRTLLLFWILAPEFWLLSSYLKINGRKGGIR